jgi:hypothetical protein
MRVNTLKFTGMWIGEKRNIIKFNSCKKELAGVFLQSYIRKLSKYIDFIIDTYLLY